MTTGRFNKRKPQPLEESLNATTSLLDRPGIETGLTTGLGLLEEDSSVDSLISALEDEREEVRRTVFWALGESKSEAAAEPLIECLRTEDEDVRGEIVDALVKLGDKAIFSLIRVSRDPDIKEPVLEAMVRIRDNIMDRRSKRLAA